MNRRRDFHQFIAQGTAQSHFGVGLMVFLELHRRIHGGRFGEVPGPLKEDAFAAGGYCLDAHDIIPSGGMRCNVFSTPDENDEDNWAAMPFTWSREDE